MNITRVFILTKSGRPPTMESTREILNCIFKGDGRLHVTTYCGKSFNQPSVIAKKLRRKDVVVIIDEDNSGFRITTGTEDIKLLRADLSTGHVASWDIVNDFVLRQEHQAE